MSAPASITPMLFRRLSAPLYVAVSRRPPTPAAPSSRDALDARVVRVMEPFDAFLLCRASMLCSREGWEDGGMKR